MHRNLFGCWRSQLSVRADPGLQFEVSLHSTWARLSVLCPAAAKPLALTVCGMPPKSMTTAKARTAVAGIRWARCNSADGSLIAETNSFGAGYRLLKVRSEAVSPDITGNPTAKAGLLPIEVEQALGAPCKEEPALNKRVARVLLNLEFTGRID